MEFDNSFEVPLAPDDAWTVLMDIPRIAPCMPGAELTEVVDPQHYAGKISVRLGPVALTFAGRIQFENIDAASRSARVKAQGSDGKGRGAANATASFRIEPSGTGSRVLIHTDLMLSGAVAQYGRGVGMIQATAAQIINQFAGNLRTQLAQQAPPLASEPIIADEAPLQAEGEPEAPPISPSPPGRAESEAAGKPDDRRVWRPMPSQPPPPAAKPISGLSLMARVLWQQVRAMFTSRRP
jgi:uncharacterized protein